MKLSLHTFLHPAPNGVSGQLQVLVVLSPKESAPVPIGWLCPIAGL
jgi:hypothetical protein